jgi:hypothetical protein
LHDARLDGPAGREALVVGQALRRQREGRFADNGRDRHFDPFVARSLVSAGFFAMDCAARQAERLRHLLPRSDLCFIETSRPLVCRIAQHAPYDRPFPAGNPPTCRWSYLPQQPGDGADAQTVDRVFFVHEPHDFRLGCVDLIARRRVVRLASVAVAIGCATQNRNLTGLGAVALTAPRPFENLRPFVFGDHALKLQHQLIFRRVGMWRLDENGLDPVAAELFDQENLIGIFSAQPIRRVDQDRLNVALGREIAQSLQARPQQAGAAEPRVFDHPFIGHAESLFARELDQCHRLAGDRVLLLLLLGGHSGVNRGSLHRSSPSRAIRYRRHGPVPGPKSHRPAPA